MAVINYDEAKELASTILLMPFVENFNSIQPSFINSVNNINGGSVSLIDSIGTIGSKSCNFDGSGSEILIDKNPNFNFGTKSFTIEFSIIPRNGVNLYQTILGQKQSSYNDGTCYIQYRASGNRITFGSRDYSNRPTVSNVSLNEKHDVLITRTSNGAFIVWVDGVYSLEYNDQIVDFNGSELTTELSMGYSPWDGEDGKLEAELDGLRILRGYSVLEGVNESDYPDYEPWYNRIPVSKVDGVTTLDGNPTSQNVIVVTNDVSNPAVLGTTLSDDLTGEYSIPVVYDKSVMVFTMQDYGEPWQAGLTLSGGDTVHPTTDNGYFYRVTEAGTTGTTEPTWPTEAGTSVVDGGVTYTTELLLKPEIAGYKTPTPIN